MQQRFKLLPIVFASLFVGALLASAAFAETTPSDPGYFRYPALHGNTLVVCAEGDLWTVSTAGGDARRLTTHLEEETHPAISPDGKHLAFTAAYDGGREVYVMPLEGGLPSRLTWEERGAFVVGWTPEGKVLYRTRAYSPLGDAQLATVDPETRVIELVPLAQAATGEWDETMETLYFTRQDFQGSHAKRYKGGTAQQLWSFQAGAEAVPLTADYPGTSKKPMWWEGRVYFASDRDGTMNLWSMAPDGGDLRQHTEHSGWDVQAPRLDGGRITYQLGADIHVYHISSDADRRVDIRLASDFEQSLERWIEGKASGIDTAHISPDGSRVAIASRGEVFVAASKKGGRFVHATRQPGVRYRTARFLDEDTLVALSDQSGEVEWWTLGADGLSAPAPWTTDGEVVRMFGVPSPDGEHLAHGDQHGNLWISRRGEGTSRRIVQADSGIRGMTFSPDSRWLAYSITGPDWIAQIYLYEIAEGTSTEVTSPRFDSYAPAFSHDGKWLYFLTDRHFRSEAVSPWGPRQPEPYFKDTTEVYALALRADAEFPFRRPDEVDVEKKKEKDKESDEKEKSGEKEEETKRRTMKRATKTRSLRSKSLSKGSLNVCAGCRPSPRTMGD